MNKSIYFALVTIASLLISSCSDKTLSFEKRRYRSGYHFSTASSKEKQTTKPNNEVKNDSGVAKSVNTEEQSAIATEQNDVQELAAVEQVAVQSESNPSQGNKLANAKSSKTTQKKKYPEIDFLNTSMLSGKSIRANYSALKAIKAKNKGNKRADLEETYEVLRISYYIIVGLGLVSIIAGAVILAQGNEPLGLLLILIGLGLAVVGMIIFIIAKIIYRNL